MASITYWTRLEPHSRTTQMQPGLQATLHDPLWLLGRQWQMGEFQADDSGMPITAQLRGRQTTLTRYHAGSLAAGTVSGQPYPRHLPLEALVEREPLTQTSHPGRAAEAGLHFWRLLKRHGVGHYRAAYQAHYPLTLDDRYTDADSQRYLRVVQGRALNGQQLFSEVLSQSSTGVSLPPMPAIAAADRPAVLHALTDWVNWYQQRFSEPSSGSEAWQSARMEHSFAVSAAAPAGVGETVFAAAEYPGGRLDWYAFNQVMNAKLGADPASATPQPLVRTVIPAPVSFQGMPNSRWWTFEDVVFNLADLEAGPEDLGRMLLQQFALTYSDDWFVLPLELEIGSVVQVSSLVITDTFGVRTVIKPFGEVDGSSGNWRMFTHTQDGGDAIANGNQLFLPPVLGSSLNGHPVEEVLLLRDEMANLAWAVEHQVENALGQASRRHETELARPENQPPSATPPTEADLTYQLMTDVPAHWIPLVPVLANNNQALQFRRGQLLKYRQGSRVELPAHGRLLNPGSALTLEAEEIDRAGATLTRAYQHTRWLNGTSYLWMARQKRPGRGEGWSGLRYDLVETVTGEPS